MDLDWQHSNPASYNNHQYYVSGVADLNPTAYLTSICSRSTALSCAVIAQAIEIRSPSCSKRQSIGYPFWNFKIEECERAGDMAREWYKLKMRSLRSHADLGSAIGLILKVFASGL
ncbi:hypothetical protein B0H14DRAFT_2755649 [Mycena olivaceomarginata]|nr:hypothetical protein B0H14DRAFT_2755649 [Mycena olivaceomarginata]